MSFLNTRSIRTIISTIGLRNSRSVVLFCLCLLFFTDCDCRMPLHACQPSNLLRARLLKACPSGKSDTLPESLLLSSSHSVELSVSFERFSLLSVSLSCCLLHPQSLTPSACTCDAQIQIQESTSAAKGDTRSSNQKQRDNMPPSSSPWYAKDPRNPTRNLQVGGLTPNDRHGSVQVVSSTNGDVAGDDPTAGLSNTLITANADVEVVSETKYVIMLCRLLF